MKAGFATFQTVRKGELLATDRHGDVRAKETCRILMPLYQGQGEDGFFLARELSSTRLRVSDALRRMQVDSVLPLLPGVHRPHESGEDLHIAPQFRSALLVDVLRLMGYRKTSRSAENCFFSRRRQRPRVRSKPMGLRF